MEIFEKVARDYLKRNGYGLQLHDIENEVAETLVQQSLSGSDKRKRCNLKKGTNYDTSNIRDDNMGISRIL